MKITIAAGEKNKIAYEIVKISLNTVQTILHRKHCTNYFCFYERYIPYKYEGMRNEVLGLSSTLTPYSLLTHSVLTPY